MLCCSLRFSLTVLLGSINLFSDYFVVKLLKVGKEKHDEDYIFKDMRNSMEIMYLVAQIAYLLHPLLSD